MSGYVIVRTSCPDHPEAVLGPRGACPECRKAKKAIYGHQWRASESAQVYFARDDVKQSIAKTQKKYGQSEKGKATRDACYKRWATPENLRKANLWSKYRLTPEMLSDLHASQNYCCAICDVHMDGAVGQQFHIDHDHDTGQVRGLLCQVCNLGLGKLGDTLEGLMKAVRYLEKAAMR